MPWLWPLVVLIIVLVAMVLFRDAIRSWLSGLTDVDVKAGPVLVSARGTSARELAIAVDEAVTHQADASLEVEMTLTADAEVTHAESAPEGQPDSKDPLAWTTQERREEAERIALWAARTAQIQAIEMPTKDGSLWEPQFSWRPDGRLHLIVWRAGPPEDAELILLEEGTAVDDIQVDNGEDT